MWEGNGRVLWSGTEEDAMDLDGVLRRLGKKLGLV